MIDADRTVIRPRLPLRLGSQDLLLGERTLIMGVVNCTPDSFYSASRKEAAAEAAVHYHDLVAEGADWIDVGGESTRPGAAPVSAADEWERVAPVIDAAREAGHPVPLSIDTSKYEVAVRALDAGAVIINDVTGLAADPRLAELAARYQAGLILMHMKGTPRTMQVNPEYPDLWRHILSVLRAAIDLAVRAGVSHEQIIVDPGIGFGKTAQHNLEIIRDLDRLAALERPILLGASRKGFIGTVLDLPAEDRLSGTLAAHVVGRCRGAHILRVHDVAPHVQALRVADAIARGSF